MSTEQTPIKKSHAVKIVRHVENAPTQIPIKKNRFQQFSQAVATKTGAPGAFIVAIATVVAWALTGPALHFSELWQLTINTATTIVTFLMVFAIQNTQNRDSKAMHLKLDELLKKAHGNSVEFVDIEELTDAELEVLHVQFKDLHEKFQNRTTR